MTGDTDEPTTHDAEAPGPAYFWRVTWVGVQLVLVFIMADKFQPFFYQAF